MKRKFNDVQNQLEDAEDMLRKYKNKYVYLVCLRVASTIS